MSDAIVETRYGKVRGTSRDTVTVWKGIPFAQPPLGPLRFQPPQPPEPWTDVRDATRFGLIAPQISAPLSALFGSGSTDIPQGEDCLYLNVWSPGADGKKRPVLVWIHGGGFVGGSGSTPWYDGTSFATQGDIVVVTLNYRLGVLGFLYLGELIGQDYASGNYGVLDQIAALEWVRDNIEAFGGDPGNVTIAGESGGGAKVSALLAMPSAAGLFHRAIIQSGPGVRMLSPQKATENAEKLLKALEIAPRDVERLAMVPVEGIFAANAKVNGSPLRGWSPVVDGSALPHHPFDPVAPAISANIPIIIGTNKDEATLFLLTDTEFSTLDTAGLRRRVSALAGEAADALIAAYRHVYPQSSPADLFAAIMSDRMMRMNSITLAERKVAQHAAPVYMYLFTWETSVLNGRLKSCHALEIPFVFDNLAVAGSFTGDDSRRFQLAEKMSEAWMTFARTGVPGAQNLPAWPAYTTEERATMIFDLDCHVVNDPQGKLREAWSAVRIPSMSES